jgi:hypothetical protein
MAEIIEISEKQKKILNVFSMYIQTYGAKSATCQLEVSYDGDLYEDIYGWGGENVRITIDTYNDINDAIFDIINRADFLSQYYDDDSKGNLECTINSETKTLSFITNIETMSTDYESLEYEINEEEFGDNKELYKWLMDMKNFGVSEGRVNYEGSGDSGYIEDHMYYIDGEAIKLPSFVVDWCYDKLNYFGGWEINEGSQGHFLFKFAEDVIYLEHGSNYESSESSKVPYIVKF